MKALEIISAINDGQRVFWKSNAYEVIKDSKNQYLIQCAHNGHCIGLTWADGQTLNGKESDFYAESTHDNHFLMMLDVNKCKALIARTPSDEITILCPNYSINIQSKYEDGELCNADFDALEELLGETLFVNDYDDLCADPHGNNSDFENDDETVTAN
jgi:hypothetical protein